MSSVEEISNMFKTESQKLKSLIERTKSENDLSIQEIVEIYYQILNVSSMSTMLKQTSSSQGTLQDKIQNTEKLINEFNEQIHPKIREILSKSIIEFTAKIQSIKSDSNSKEDIEKEAKLYEELRQKMSTKEFVEQYEKGL